MVAGCFRLFLNVTLACTDIGFGGFARIQQLLGLSQRLLREGGLTT
jgi:hypothetical protein